MIRKNWRHMLKASWFQSVFTVCIIAFLLFFLQILAMMSFKVGQYSHQVEQKLGVYFYLEDNPETKDQTYSQAIDLMTELERAGMRVEFYSKDQAFELLSDRLPNVISNLEKFGIDNPLPPTLYVMFDSQDEYDTLKQTVGEYEQILGNMQDVTEGISFGEQESRVATAINMMNAVRVGTHVLIGILVVIIVAFLRYAIKINFLRFQQQIEVEKLLGATYRQIVSPFILHVGIVLICAFVLMLGIAIAALSYLNPYFVEVYRLSVYEALLPDTLSLLHIGGIELVGVVLVSSLFAGLSLYGLLKKV